jgi:hypothetical protein
MNMLKKMYGAITIAAAVGILSIAALAAEIVVSGIGAGSASDQSTADNQAMQQATANANQICPGFTHDMETTSDNCASLGNSDNPTYLCAVTVKALCRVGR